MNMAIKIHVVMDVHTLKDGCVYLQIRSQGELDVAMRLLKKAKSAFTNAGDDGETRMWDVISLEKAVANEVHPCLLLGFRRENLHD